MNLTKDFTLEEFCQSPTATRMGIDMVPSTAVELALAGLAQNVLQPLRDKIGRPLRVTSGYRPQRLNAAIGGAANSQHVLGEAADIQCDGLTPLQLCRAVIDAGLPFDQLIYEFGPTGWMHVSHSPASGQRGQVLSSSHQPGMGTVYHAGLPQ